MSNLVLKINHLCLRGETMSPRDDLTKQHVGIIGILGKRQDSGGNVHAVCVSGANKGTSFPRSSKKCWAVHSGEPFAHSSMGPSSPIGPSENGKVSAAESRVRPDIWLANISSVISFEIFNSGMYLRGESSSDSFPVDCRISNSNTVRTCSQY